MQTQPLPCLFATFAALFLAAWAVPAQAAPPNPILYATSTEYYSAGGKTWVRYRYDVLNKEQYPADMFAAAPNLPPCGANANSSRTWVDFFDGTGRRIYGFCARGSPDDLGKICLQWKKTSYRPAGSISNSSTARPISSTGPPSPT